MQANEVYMWQTWLTQEPRGMRRHDYHAAQISLAIYTILQSFSGSNKKIGIEDSLLKFEEVNSQKRQEDQNITNALAMLQMFGRGKHSDSLSKLENDLKEHYKKVDSDDNSKQDE
jgi:hypothetical protein